MAAAHDALRELQTIQEQRLADEQLARDRARRAAETARLEAERMERDRREEAERDQRLAIVRIETDARIKAEHELARAKLEAETRARVEIEVATARHAVELQALPPPAPLGMPGSRVPYIFVGALAIAGLALALAINTAIDRGDALRKRTDELVATNQRVDGLTRDLATLRADLGSKMQQAERALAAARDDNTRLTDELSKLRSSSSSSSGTSTSSSKGTRPHAQGTAPSPPTHQPLDLRGCTKGAALDCMPSK